MSDGKKEGTHAGDDQGSIFDAREEGRPSAGKSIDSEETQRNSKEGGGEAVGRQGFVYFIETEDREFVKIGYSRQVMVRLSQLGTLRPGSFSLRVMGSIPGTTAIERWLHERFIDERDNGEWFRKTPRITAFIESLGLMPPVMVERPERRRRVTRTRALRIQSEVEPELELEPEPELASEPEINTAEAPQIKNPAAVALGKRSAKLPEEALAFFRKQGRKGGKVGAKARMQKLTPEQRSDIARKAGLAGGRGRKKGK